MTTLINKLEALKTKYHPDADLQDRETYFENTDKQEVLDEAIALVKAATEELLLDIADDQEISRTSAKSSEDNGQYFDGKENAFEEAYCKVGDFIGEVIDDAS